MFKFKTEIKISVYESLIRQIDNDIQKANNEKIMQESKLENYNLVYDTLKKYLSIVAENVQNKNVPSSEYDNVLKHLQNIKQLLTEHENNNKTSVSLLKGKLKGLQEQRENAVKMLKNENTVLKNIINGNINENGQFIKK